MTASGMRNAPARCGGAFLFVYWDASNVPQGGEAVKNGDCLALSKAYALPN